MRYKSDPAYALSGKGGLTYDLSERLSVAAAYSFPVKLHLDGGMSINVGNPEFYRRTGVSLEQIWPAVHRAGVAFRGDTLRVAFDVDWIKWSGAFNTLSFQLEDPFVETPLGTRSSLLVLKHEWRDQLAFALGVEYRPDTVAFRAGYNYGKTPVSGAGINPALRRHKRTPRYARTGPAERRYGIRRARRSTRFRTGSTEPTHPTGIYRTRSSDPGLSETPFFQHSKTMHVFSLILGIKIKFRNSGEQKRGSEIMRRIWIPLLIGTNLATIALLGYLFFGGSVETGEGDELDPRTIVYLSAGQKALLLGEMRLLLSATQGVLHHVNENEFEAAAKLASSVGMQMAQEVGGEHPDVVHSLPVAMR